MNKPPTWSVLCIPGLSNFSNKSKFLSEFRGRGEIGDLVNYWHTSPLSVAVTATQIRHSYCEFHAR